MQQLVNFSVYPLHISLFNADWSALAAWVAGQGLDGIELLVGDDPPPELPPGLVRGVHLPYWIRWLDIWCDGAAAAITPDERMFLAGGARDAAHMVTLQHATWQRAAALQPQYAVFHVSHVTMEHAFTRAYTYTDRDVIVATADLLNAVAATFPGGEPPSIAPSAVRAAAHLSPPSPRQWWSTSLSFARVVNWRRTCWHNAVPWRVQHKQFQRNRS